MRVFLVVLGAGDKFERNLDAGPETGSVQKYLEGERSERGRSEPLRLAQENDRRRMEAKRLQI